VTFNPITYSIMAIFVSRCNMTIHERNYKSNIPQGMSQWFFLSPVTAAFTLFCWSEEFYCESCSTNVQRILQN